MSSNTCVINSITPKLLNSSLPPIYSPNRSPCYDVESTLVLRHGQNCAAEQHFLFLDVATSSSDPSSPESAAVELDSEPFNFSYKSICRRAVTYSLAAV